eukprot:CAMPEP_0172321840 /NCGR_PEP_ID=MMETSP1058-20130122/44427_1 /TAXON_ID=83371 /ORGANISM="Detonula confervacea, Strain CCMP 353" /LENGTH=2855 /DNA_ID=CAMNT_0013037445 /DNA_START=302 /DNA_END=8869 /DNA_ORIENTATION=+
MTVGSGGKNKARSSFVQPVAAQWEERTTTTPGVINYPPGQHVVSTATLQKIANAHAAAIRDESSSSSGGGEKVVAEAPPDTLKVSVLGASRGKSSSCTYSLVEFSNTHHADTIIVHSTYIEPTAVFPPKWDSDPLSLKNPPTSPAFHGEYYQDRQLHIPPRTAVTVPVSIIPHWRKPSDLDQHHRHRHYRKLNSTEGKTPSSSTAAADQDDHLSLLTTITDMGSSTNNATFNNAIHADLLDMIGNSGTTSPLQTASNQRAQLLDSSSIHETLVANTSWGFVQMKVPYVCSPQNSREYEFGLPNNLMFMDGGGGWYARRNTTPTVELAYMFGNWDFNPIRDSFDPFIYRVYMNNPTSNEFRIWDVYTTKPHLVGAEMQHRFDSSTWPRKMKNATYHYPFKGFVHTPKNNNIYVVTLRLFPDNFTSDMACSIQDLGFLEIHTSAGSFSIALDFIPNGGRGGVIHGIGENRTTLADVHLVQDHVMDGLLRSGLDLNSKKPPAEPPMTISKSYRAKDFEALSTSDELKYIGSTVISQTTSNTTDTTSLNLTSFMKADPININFGSITTGSRMIRIPLKLANVHPDGKPLRIMRISVAMSMVSDNGNGNITDISMENHRMEIGVDFSDGSQMTLLNGTSGKETYVFSQEMVLPAPSSNFEYPIHVWCRFNASQGKEKPTTILQMARFYTGSILIRASTDTMVPYRDWERQLLLDHSSGGGSWGGEGQSSQSLQSQFVLQIPFEGSVLPGNLGSPTESLLFPTHFHVLPVDERVKIMQRTNGKIPKYYDRELDITNNFAVPISIVGMRILNSSPSSGDYSNNFCKTRFSIASPFDGKGSSDGRSSSWPTAEKGEKWKGLSVRYHVHEEDDDQPYHEVAVRKCILSLETDRAGKQSLPLIIYSGAVVVDIDRQEDDQLMTVHCLVTKKDGTTIFSPNGMPCTTDWLGNTREGKVLQGAIGQMQVDSRTRQGSWKSSKKSCSTRIDGGGGVLLESYFRSLLSTSSKLVASGFSSSSSTLLPIILPFGAIGNGESMSRSILLTNMNHAPIDVTATTAALGNMVVSIGVIVSGSLHDAVLGMAKEQRHHTEGKEGGDGDADAAAYFLANSPLAKELFSKFQNKVDISPSPHAHGSELLSLYNRQAIIDTFHNVSEYVSNYIGDEEMNMDCSRGFMLATDGTYIEEIKSRKLGKKKWTIPPGGVARFMVTVKAPSRLELKNDVTPFVGTGLVLETNHGQAFPIVVTYSAIAGQLQLKPTGDYNVSDIANMAGASTKQTTLAPLTVQVPLTFKDPTLTPSVDAFAQRRGVSLSVESTFSQDLYLSEIRSCNKWFNFFLPANNAAAREFFSKMGPSQYLQIKGTSGNANQEEQSLNKTILHLGKVLSALSCSHPSSDTSFYACALAWLENRDQIQPPGCGLSEQDVVAIKVNTSESLENRIATAKTSAIGALRDVVAFLSVRYVDEGATGKPGAESKGGYVHFSRIHMFAHARKMWDEVVSLGLNAITGHIHAKTVYFTDPNQIGLVSGDYQYFNHHHQNQKESMWSSLQQSPLSIPVSSVLLQSTLEIPTLFGGNTPNDSTIGVVDFDTVHAADTATRYVPITNPTAMTIRVRLAAIDSIDGSFGEDEFAQKNVFVQGSPDDSHPWWTGGSYWMSDDQGSLIPASHNVTIKSGAGAYVSLLNPALHTMSAFVLGCGKRCGLRSEQDAIGEEKNYSPIGSASGDGSALFGRSWEKSTTLKQDENKTPRQALGMTDPPSFSLGRIQNEIVIPPYGAAELGPVYFRPPGRGDYKGTIFIENSLTGFEQVEVRGRGGWENLVFLDQVNPNVHGGDVEFRFGRSALVFPGSQSGVGPLQKGVGPVVRSVRLANHGDFPVDVSRVYMASSEVMHFTHKRRHPSSSFRSSTGSHDRKCSARGFILPGCYDRSYPKSWIEIIFLWSNAILDTIIEKLSWSKSSEQHARNEHAEEAENFYRDGFTLKPNQTQTIFVMHYPDCTFQTSYASVIVEIGGRSQAAPTSRNQQTFRKRKVELLVGYDMSASEFRQCIPYKPPESSISIWERKIVFQMPSLLQDILSFGLTRLTDTNGNPYIPRRPIEVTLLAASFILLLFALSLDLIFTVEISATRKSCPSWKPTCRCLARADPTSSDLVSIGKEQTKHVLLSRFKKEGVLPSHCVHSDGSFSREKAGSNASGTHSEAIFDHLNVVNESKMNKDEGHGMLGLLPCGLGWRTALRRGVGLPSSPKNHASGNYPPELQYLTRTRDRYLKKQQEQKAVKKVAFAPHTVTPIPRTTPTRPTKTQTHDATGNGHSSVTKPIKTTAMAAPLPQDRKVEPQTKKKIQTPAANGRNILATNKPPPQSKPSTDISNISKAVSKGTSNAKQTISDRAEKNSSVGKAKNVETGKIKHQQKVNSGGASSNVVQTDVKSKVVDTKGKQKQRNEAKTAKNERANRTETKKDISKQEESSSVLGKSVASQKAHSAKPTVANASSGSSSKGKQHEKELNEHATATSPSKKELPATPTKQMRQTKKTSNGTKSAEQKGKQGKQKATSKKATIKNPPKSSVPTEKSAAKRPQSDAEFPPLLSAAQSPTPTKPKPAQQKASVRPPPGLLAPPGFLDQPDLDVLSNPSSPSSSPQRLLSHPSPMIQTIPGMEIINSPPLNHGLLSLIGSGGDKPLESSLFLTEPNGNSPRASSDSALSIPVFRPQSFTPPILEPSLTTDLFGAGSDFNVSNFLDGILSESTQQAPIRNEVVQKPAEASEPIPFQANTIGVSLDPWNNFDNPLAALQGAVNHQESTIIAGIPLTSNAPSLLATSTPSLLATSILQNSANTTYAEPAIASIVSASIVSDNGGDDDDFLEPDSFYNQLLGEED